MSLMERRRPLAVVNHSRIDVGDGARDVAAEGLWLEWTPTMRMAACLVQLGRARSCMQRASHTSRFSWLRVVTRPTATL